MNNTAIELENTNLNIALEEMTEKHKKLEKEYLTMMKEYKDLIQKYSDALEELVELKKKGNAAVKTTSKPKLRLV